LGFFDTLQTVALGYFAGCVDRAASLGAYRRDKRDSRVWAVLKIQPNPITFYIKREKIEHFGSLGHITAFY